MHRKIVNVGAPTKEKAAGVVVAAGLFVVSCLRSRTSLQTVFDVVLEEQTRAMLQWMIYAHLVAEKVFHQRQRGPHADTVVINAPVMIFFLRVAAGPGVNSLRVEAL